MYNRHYLIQSLGHSPGTFISQTGKLRLRETNQLVLNNTTGQQQTGMLAEVHWALGPL